ncbi:MAG: YdcH family protein [Ketobacteraceae bacterium]|nr:YdcH family protein [Ketobacteraceae bacterium]
MSLQKHDLVHELPESKDTIHHLKMNDQHFARLFDKYHEVDHEVYRLENGAANSSDEYVETRKKERLKLKDQLYAMIREYEATSNA